MMEYLITYTAMHPGYFKKFYIGVWLIYNAVYTHTYIYCFCILVVDMRSIDGSLLSL